jgi:outer membrane protein
VKLVGGPAGVRIADARLLQPTVFLQYHFSDLGLINPCLGVGINYPSFFDGKAMGTFKSSSLKNSTGLTLQVGGDIMIAGHWGDVTVTFGQRLMA